MSSNRQTWFPAKRYGWGWGVPTRWQGWMVLIGYVAAVVLGIPYLQHRRGDALYVAYLLVLTALLGLICWWKGERPQWRGNRPTDREGPGT